MSSERRDSIFLTLAPETGKNFNADKSAVVGTDAASRASSFSSNESKAGESAVVTTDSSLAQALQQSQQKSTRSDSVSSAGSARKRFLKLNPVRHNVDAKESDFVEVDD
jgi:hypothetical protein